MNAQELEQLIQRYFDATTTSAEETLLRRELARPEAQAPSADEARAVLGLFAAQRKRHTARRHSRSRIWAAAAGVALLLAAGGSFVAQRDAATQASYIAYVDGDVITDSQHVLDMMRSDLDDLRDASVSVDDAIAADLEQVFNAIHSKQQ